MTDRPIIFSGPMVRALLDGRKTQTRRLVRWPKWATEIDEIGNDGYTMWCIARDSGCLSPALPQYVPGDRLWVRESFAMGFDYDDDEKPIGEVPKPFYAATYDGVHWYDTDKDEWRDAPRWTPPIHMPRWASRITLHVTGVKVERLQDISEADAQAEGAELDDRHAGEMNYYEGFRAIWERINGPDSWAANPWVVAVTFKVVRANIDSPEAKP